MSLEDDLDRMVEMLDKVNGAVREAREVHKDIIRDLREARQTETRLKVLVDEVAKLADVRVDDLILIRSDAIIKRFEKESMAYLERMAGTMDAYVGERLQKVLESSPLPDAKKPITIMSVMTMAHALNERGVSLDEFLTVMSHPKRRPGSEG